jgi:hypothetical protein
VSLSPATLTVEQAIDAAFPSAGFLFIPLGNTGRFVSFGWLNPANYQPLQLVNGTSIGYYWTDGVNLVTVSQVTVYAWGIAIAVGIVVWIDPQRKKR